MRAKKNPFEHPQLKKFHDALREKGYRCMWQKHMFPESSTDGWFIEYWAAPAGKPNQILQIWGDGSGFDNFAQDINAETDECIAQL